jgi:hypothetical protein
MDRRERKDVAFLTTDFTDGHGWEKTKAESGKAKTGNTEKIEQKHTKVTKKNGGGKPRNTPNRRTRIGNI